MTSAEATEEKPLKFAYAPMVIVEIAAIEGDEVATVRFADEKDLQEGDRLQLLTEKGEPFGTADVTGTAEVAAATATARIEQRGARYGIESTELLISTLNDFYAAEIGAMTEVKVVFLDPELRWSP